MKDTLWTDAPTAKNIEEIISILTKNRPNILSHLQIPEWNDDWWKHFSDPFALSGMQTACERIFKAIQNKERIIVFGDFDSDGITSTAILTKAIANFGGLVSYRIPDRSTDNHGLKNYLLDEIASRNVSLVITCDCGINDFEQAIHAQKIGLDIIITDHHTPKTENFPHAAVTVVNPKLNPKYSEQELSGSAVALKMVQALAETKWKNKKEAAQFWQDFIEISAIGVVADCVDLVGENRLITQMGLKKMNTTNWHGLQTLLASNTNNDGPITEETIGFFIAPHLNAASRIGDRLLAAQLFLGDPDNSEALVKTLQSLNTKRKLLTQAAVEIAIKQINPKNKIQIIFHAEWQAGILGLVASRICEKTGQPTIACSIKNDGTIGASCRSIEGVSVIKILNQVSNDLKYFGGHAGAAGFVCESENFETLKKNLNNIGNQQIFPPKTITPDAWITPPLINDELLEYCQTLAPFGMKNPMPIFGFENVFITEKKCLGKAVNILILLDFIKMLP